MPYRGPDDPSLPETVREMPTPRRRAFVAAFNSAFADRRDGESEAEREARAFAVAHAAARRAGAKDYEADDEHASMGPVERPVFAAGATSFAEYDRWSEEARRQTALGLTFDVFGNLVRNVMDSEGLTVEERVTRMRELVDELDERIGAVSADPEVAFREARATREAHVAALRLALGVKQETKLVDGVALPREDFADRGQPDMPTTWKLPLTRRPGAVDADRIADAITALQPGGFRGNPVDLTDDRETVIGRIRTAIGRLDDDDAKERLRGRLDRLRGAKTAAGLAGTFRVTKDRQSAAWRWIAIHTNRYYDREREVFPEAAHKEYVGWVDETGNYPTLRLWHVPHDIGRADAIDYADGFVVATGTFAPGYEHVAERLAAASKETPIGCSHGFSYDPRDRVGDAYTRYRTFEISVLPLWAAANPLTDFGVEQEEASVLSQEKRPFFEAVLGADGVRALEESLSTLDARAKEQGLAFKEEAAAADAGDSDAGDADAAAPRPAEPVPYAEQQPPAVDGGTPQDPTPDPQPSSPAALERTAEEQSQKAGAEAFKALIADAVATALAPVSQRLDELEAGYRALAAGTDAQIAQAIAPRVGAPIVPASLSEQTTAPPEAAAAVKAAQGPEPPRGAATAQDQHLTALLAALRAPSMDTV